MHSPLKSCSLLLNHRQPSQTKHYLFPPPYNHALPAPHTPHILNSGPGGIVSPPLPVHDRWNVLVSWMDIYAPALPHSLTHTPLFLPARMCTVYCTLCTVFWEFFICNFCSSPAAAKIIVILPFVYILHWKSYFFHPPFRRSYFFSLAYICKSVKINTFLIILF